MIVGPTLTQRTLWSPTVPLTSRSTDAAERLSFSAALMRAALSVYTFTALTRIGSSVNPSASVSSSPRQAGANGHAAQHHSRGLSRLASSLCSTA